MNSPTEQPKPTTAAPEVPDPCEDETHSTQEITAIKGTSKRTISNDDIDSIFSLINSFGSTMDTPNEQPKPTAAPKVPRKDETHKTQKTTNVVRTTTTFAPAPTIKTSKSNDVTAVTTSLSGIFKNSQPTLSFKIKPVTTTTYTTTSKQYTPPKFNGAVQKATTTSHVQNSADCDETKTASGEATSVDVVSSYPFPIPHTKVTESHNEETVKSVPTSVATPTWGKFPVVSTSGPHVYEWQKKDQSGSTFQQNSETFKYMFGAGAPQSAASKTINPAVEYHSEISGQGNGAARTKFDDLKTLQLVDLANGSALPVVTLMEILKRNRDC